MNDYTVTFIMDYFSVATVISADDEEQAERLATQWLAENGLNLAEFKVLDVNMTLEGVWTR